MSFREILVYRINDDCEKWLRNLEIYLTAHFISDDKIKLAKMLLLGGEDL